MFGNNFGFSNSMPTATQPYGYPMNPYMNNNMMNNPAPPVQQNTQQNQTMPTNTNKIYVNGLEDVRNRPLAPNSDFVFLDNDKPIIYQKIVDGKGQFEVKAFDIIPHTEPDNIKNNNSINLDDYVLRKDFEKLQEDMKEIKTKLDKFNQRNETIKKTEGAVNGETRTSGNTGNNGATGTNSTRTSI